MNVINTRKGFTLIELMIVVAIIGILAAIAIPKFSQLITKGNEANTKGNLGAIRSALSIYYGDTEGQYPTDVNSLASLTAGNKYLTAIPVAKFPSVGATNPGHPDSSAVLSAAAGALPVVGATEGGWMYSNNAAGNDTNWGRLLANCAHVDTRGNQWTSY